MAIALLRQALDAFARLDTVAAARIVKEDKAIDDEFRAFVRKLITYMMEDPRTISVALDFLLWPRPSSASATTPRTSQNSLSTSSRELTCAMPRVRTWSAKR